MNTRSKLLAAFSAVVITASAFAAAVASPAGNWKWTSQGRNGPQEATAKFEVKDGTLTGTVTSPRGDTPISKGTFKDGNIAFVTELTFGENTFAIKYAGKLEGDTIKGTIERPGFGGGEPTKVDWTATRAK
jgi:opacity protein-like surface antigen